MKITVIGAGAWGTALAIILAEKDHVVTLWGHNPTHLESIRKHHWNQRYLPGIPLPRSMMFEYRLPQAVQGSEAIVIAVPSKAFREVCKDLKQFSGIAVSVTKGIEFDTGLTMSGILSELMPHAHVAALSGPTLALEVAKGIPSAIVSASREISVATKVQELFHRPTFRVYSSTDILGVELGGALKNVIAIAAGVGDGLGFGDNSKAALITRAIVEIRRLGVACGANADTFSGLSGLGDLTVTCFSRLSRNRSLGEKLGHGEKLHDILAQSISVAEGYPTARSAHHLAKNLGVETPIMEEIYSMLYQGKNPAQAVRDLISRESKPESETPS